MHQELKIITIEFSITLIAMQQTPAAITRSPVLSQVQKTIAFISKETLTPFNTVRRHETA